MTDVTVKLKADDSALKKTLDDFAKNLSRGVSGSVKGLGIDKMAGVAAKVSGGGGGGGAVAGAAAGGAIGAVIGSALLPVLGSIYKSLQDFPVVAAIFKLLKLVLMLLWIPLIPIMKPALQALAKLVGIMAKFFTSDAGGAIMRFIYTLLLGPIMAIGVAFLEISKILEQHKPELEAAFKWISEKIVLAGEWIGKAFEWLVASIKEKGIAGTLWEVLKKIGTWIWEVLVGIWNNVLVPLFTNLATNITLTMYLLNAAWNEFVLWIGKLWKDVLKPAFDAVMLEVSTKLWPDVIKPAFSKAVDDMVAWAKSLVKSPAKAATTVSGAVVGGAVGGPIGALVGGVAGSKLADAAKAWGFDKLFASDAIITPSGKFIQTDPADYIMATKNPRGMGGGNVTINVNSPSVRSDADIDELVRKISRSMQQGMRRYNSYGNTA